MALHGSAAQPAAAPYTSGRYYTPDGILTVTAGSAVTSGTIYMAAGYIRRPVTISALVHRITTLVAGGNVQVSLYASDPTSGYPTGAPLFTSASQATTAAGPIEVAVSQTLAPGRYWLALQFNNSTNVFETIASNNVGYSNIIGLTATANLIAATNTSGLSKAGTFGTWPTLTGNIATDSLSEIGNVAPAWAFKVA